MARRSLDRTKPFAEVIGNDPSILYRYMQLGRYFDESDNEIDKDGKEVAAKIEADPAPAAGPSEAAIQARIDAAVKAALEKGYTNADEPEKAKAKGKGTLGKIAAEA